MNQKLAFSLTYALLTYNNLNIKNINQLSIFMSSQIYKMPDFFYLAVKILSKFFEIIVFIFHFKRFHNLSDARKIKIISLIKEKEILFFSLLIRLCESNILVKYYEINNE